MKRWSLVLAAVASVAIAHAAPQDRTTRSEPRPTKNPVEGNPQAISNGGAMFRTRCAGCHGPDARGYLGPDLTGVWSRGNTDDRVFDIVRHGVPGKSDPRDIGKNGARAIQLAPEIEKDELLRANRTRAAGGRQVMGVAGVFGR